MKEGCDNCQNRKKKHNWQTLACDDDGVTDMRTFDVWCRIHVMHVCCNSVKLVGVMIMMMMKEKMMIIMMIWLWNKRWPLVEIAGQEVFSYVFGDSWLLFLADAILLSDFSLKLSLQRAESCFPDMLCNFTKHEPVFLLQAPELSFLPHCEMSSWFQIWRMTLKASSSRVQYKYRNQSCWPDVGWLRSFLDHLILSSIHASAGDDDAVIVLGWQTASAKIDNKGSLELLYHFWKWPIILFIYFCANENVHR